jgi:hypothetical protein
MSKNINEPGGLQEIISRIDKLTAETKPVWGKMNVNQMLRHVYDAANFAYETKTERKKPSFFTRNIMKWMIFHVPAPKGIKTFPSIDMVAKGINPPDFAAERDAVKTIFTKISGGGDFQPNPFLGELTPDEWGKLCYVLANHHLKQFGV